MQNTNTNNDDQGELRQSEDQKPKLISICAWCFPNEKGPGLTHGICKRHLEELLQQARETISKTRVFPEDSNHTEPENYG